MKNKFIIFIAFIIILISFWEINKLNYKKHREILYLYVSHPDKLPKKEIISLTSFWYKNLVADFYWLNTIQYIWSNVISSEYKKYLFVILDIITDLNPYFESPYKIWMLLLPNYNQRYEKLSLEEEKKYIEQANLIWLKWVRNFCISEKVDMIKKEFDLNKIISDEKYKDPCKSFDMPFNLAYVYFYYLKNPLESSNYYKVASANSNALKWAYTMASIMLGKWWSRQKAFHMMLNIAKSSEENKKVDEEKNKLCYIYADEIEKKFDLYFNNPKLLSWKILENINQIRTEIFWDIKDNQNKEEKDKIFYSNCVEYINKAHRELNLFYIEYANQKFKENNWWETAYTVKELFWSWYIDYIPIDFQQYNDKHGIIYKYEKEYDRFDYHIEYRP